jgi:outer membrane lipoprotein-sorting protein
MSSCGRLVRIAVLVAVVVPIGARGQEPSPVAILERAAELYGEVESLCADFMQELAVPLLGEERTGRGRMCQAQPDRFAMRFSEPDGDAVIADGTWVWVYYPSLDEKQVIKLPMTAGSRGFDFHREFLENPATKYEATYEGREVLGGSDAHRIRLVPRTPVPYAAAVIWIDVADSTLRRVRVEEENGSVRTVTLENLELNPEVDSSWFTFTPPPGAVIISR